VFLIALSSRYVHNNRGGVVGYYRLRIDRGAPHAEADSDEAPAPGIGRLPMMIMDYSCEPPPC